MKILAFAGSTSRQSINRKLVRHSLSFFPDNDITFLDLNDFEMPVFSVDKEKSDGYPEYAHQLLSLIEAADLVILSLAEHNGSYSTAFKNTLDWCSRINGKVFQDKPVFLMSTSPGGFGGGNVMAAALSRFPKMGANIITHFSLPSFHQNFQEENGIVSEELSTLFLTAIDEVKNHFATYP
ncbi:NADPH-dependent FMN reductase [Pedobacter frigoris]|uniref:NAD(P)H-dependent oxidoreductase n=1 Tax=Pedobacter frigoris TaxID=2571272 RepID=A0A4U1CDK9_9SPHI|nr:NAD(P)H-dependent oxidoreductase [Pedobacter frigoris]TKC04371.1 NAD(P)H-dependent oxidoreductase [Pedobacter frigoris]